MDTEFHYYITYLIATRAGFSVEDALIVANASQGVDDNHIPLIVNKEGAEPYKNHISQTMDITRPYLDNRIYPFFHFVPGDRNAIPPTNEICQNPDWVTTPNSPLAKQMFEEALRTKNLYRIGVCAHVYADTWAHQNFVGMRDKFNEIFCENTLEIIENTLNNNVLNVGHGAAKHQPDIPGLIWTDNRLINSTVNNLDRFLDAARHMFRCFSIYTAKIPENQRYDAERQLVRDIAAVIGQPTKNCPAMLSSRIENYRRRALQIEYGGCELPQYDELKWVNEALQVDQKDVSLFEKLHQKIAENAPDIYIDIISRQQRISCLWLDSAKYAETNWFQFQQAIMAHVECAQRLLQNLSVGEIGQVP